MSRATDDFEALRQSLGEHVLGHTEFRGELTLTIDSSVLLDTLRRLRDHHGYELLLDISSLDHFGQHPRFELVYELASLDDSKHLRIKTPIAEDEKAPSAVEIWPAANWHEREIYDMMGIIFDRHPDLRRILMWEGYPFFPLRKDFPLAGRQTEMPDVAFTGVAPLEGGPFVTAPGADTLISREPRAR